MFSRVWKHSFFIHTYQRTYFCTYYNRLTTFTLSSSNGWQYRSYVNFTELWPNILLTRETSAPLRIKLDVNSFNNSKKVIVKGSSNVSKTFNWLAKGKTYYVKVRSYKYVDGVKYYSGWSDVKRVKISKWYIYTSFYYKYRKCQLPGGGWYFYVKKTHNVIILT